MLGRGRERGRGNDVDDDWFLLVDVNNIECGDIVYFAVCIERIGPFGSAGD